MDKTAMFQLTYGLFIVGTQINEKKYGCVVNTAIQVTSEPNRMSVTMLKSNETTKQIIEKGSFTVSVLSRETSLDTISGFGLRSSKDFNKFAEINYQTDENNNPYLTETILCYMSLNVWQTIDLGSHFMFICDVIDAKNINQGKPMTYADYRILKNEGSLEAASVPEQSEEKKQYICSVCHYVYDGETPFEELPEDYVCPICKQPKSVFVKE